MKYKLHNYEPGTLLRTVGMVSLYNPDVLTWSCYCRAGEIVTVVWSTLNGVYVLHGCNLYFVSGGTAYLYMTADVGCDE